MIGLMNIDGELMLMNFASSFGAFFVYDSGHSFDFYFVQIFTLTSYITLAWTCVLVASFSHIRSVT